MKKYRLDTTLFFTLLLSFFCFILIHDLLGETLLKRSDWDSYTLQASRWLMGKVDLGQNYPWLELAIYNGKYFVSFPPIPSVVILPFVLLFGLNTPNNFIIILYTLLTIAVFYKACRHFGLRDIYAAFWSVFVVLGCNALWMSTNGGVWFQAQVLNLLFCGLSLLFIVKDKPYLSFISLALAVGCRPFSVCYFPALIAYLYFKDKRPLPAMKRLLSQWKFLIAPAAIGLCYLLYNYIRFDSFFEFGHNYLPEFMESPQGQFSLSYVLVNFYNLFLLPLQITPNLGLEYPFFNGFMFFIANPLFAVFFVYLIKDAIKKQLGAIHWVLVVTLAANLFFLLLHKTLGGWQFGARYTVDMIPFAFFFLLLCGIGRPTKWEMFLAIFALMFNAYGALAIVLLS